MKAVLLSRLYDQNSNQLGDVDCFEVPEPNIVNEDDVKIQISYASICGSDPNTLKGLFPNKKIGNTMGHELSGTVVELGVKAQKNGLKVGERVTGNFFLPCGACENCQRGMKQFCRNGRYLTGAMAQYIVWRESQVYKLPEDIDMRQACLTEPFTIATHAVEVSDMKIGSRVAISGGGGIGLMLVQLAKLCGASSVTLLEPFAEKRDIAMKIGADFVLDPAESGIHEKILDITNGNGFDVIFESSGNGKAAEFCLEMAGVGCHIVYFAMYPLDYHLQLNLLENCYHKELRIQGMYLAQNAFPKAISMLRRVDLEPLISKIYSLDQCKEAFADAMSGKEIKILFDCQV